MSDAPMPATVIVSKRLWGCLVVGISALSEGVVVFALPGTWSGLDKVYGSFFSVMILTAGLVSLAGYRVDGELDLAGGQLTLRATHSYAYDVRWHRESRWRPKRVWRKGSKVRVDCGRDQLAISFAHESDRGRFLTTALS